jgi:WD40 repeat protein
MHQSGAVAMRSGNWKSPFTRVLIAALALGALPQGSRGADPEGLTPILALDAAGHRGWVSRLLLVPSYEPKLISTGHDKTVRFWDLRSGEPEKTWRVAIDRAETGRINAAALSPDGHLLAIAGQSALVPAGEQVILVVDVEQDTVVRSLRVISGAIRDLAFSPDGRWLAACGNHATLRLWDARTGNLSREFAAHGRDVCALAFSPDGRRLVTGSWDGESRLWSVPDGAELAVLSGQGRNLLRVAWSPDGRTIATGGSGPSVWLWEPDGRFRYAWNDFGTGVSGDSSAAVSLLKFSPDSLSLLAGWGSRVRQVAAAVLLDMTDGHVRYRLPNVPNTPMCGLFLPAGDQFAVGFASGDIWFCAANDGHIIRNLRTQANGHFAAAWSPDGRAIAWGDINGSGSSIQGTRPLERAFCLETLDFAPPPDATFQRSIGDWGDWSIQRIENSVVQVDWRGSPVSTFKLARPDDRVRCRSLLSHGRAVVGSQHGVYVFEAATGRPIYQLPGHTDTVWCLAPSPDGRYLLTGSGDMTLEIWNLDRYELVVSLFVIGDEWVAWTPQGYYAASLGGEGLLGWHVNRGNDQLADFFPAAQFRKQFYRPDVIRRVLETGDPWSAVAVADREREQASSPLTISAAIPPEVQTRLLTSEAQESDGTTTLVATARRRGNELISGLQLIIDGRPAEYRAAPPGEHADSRPVPESLLPDSFEAQWTVKLPPGEHSLVVEAQTAASVQLSKPMTINVPGPATAWANLYVLSIGVADSRLAPFAEADATSLAQSLAQAGSKLYAKVVTHVLTGNSATAARLAQELQWLRDTARAEDVVIVFYAGGVYADDRGELLFLGSSGQAASPVSQILSGGELKTSLEQTHGRVFFWTDARLSGQSNIGRPGAGEAQSRRAIDKLLRDLARPESGIAALAAATSRETAKDDAQRRHGLLTLALLDGLGGRADRDGDGKIAWAELARFLTRSIKPRSTDQHRPAIATPVLLPPTTLVRP